MPINIELEKLLIELYRMQTNILIKQLPLVLRQDREMTS